MNTHVVIDMDEGQVIEFGSELHCKTYANKHNGKVVANGGEPCYYVHDVAEAATVLGITEDEVKAQMK